MPTSSSNGARPRRVRRTAPLAAASVPVSSAGMTTAGFAEVFARIVDNIELVIKGKGAEIRMVLIAMLGDGHVLLEDMPGTGKTMMARSIAQSINASTNRVQCTPDLLPSDITGSPIFDQATREFTFQEGPAFCNVLLVDEINRATPKTQSALLEAMQERRVSVARTTYRLPKPFLVLATQNPIELAGTFPLPEAQLDRFLLKLNPGYPDREAEIEVLQTNRKKEVIDDLESVVDTETVLAMMEFATGIEVAPSVEAYIVDLCQATRTDTSLMIGASTRAALALMRASRVLAASQGRSAVVPDDIKSLAKPVLAHRVLLTPDAGLREETVDNVIERILARVKVPVSAG